MFYLTIFVKYIIYFQLNQKFFNISIDSSSLDIFSSPFLHLLQIKEIIDVFSNRNDISGFSNFLYLPQITQYDSFILLKIF